MFEFLNEKYSFSELFSGKKSFAKGGVLLAPNGKKSNLTPEQYKLVRTPAFKKWFGDWENDPKNASKVVDENGEPLVVWHGTEKGNIITQFYQRGSAGIHFGTKKAAIHRREATDYEGKKEYNLIPVFLDIKKPIRIEEDVNWEEEGAELDQSEEEYKEMRTIWQYMEKKGYDIYYRGKGVIVSQSMLPKGYTIKKGNRRPFIVYDDKGDIVVGGDTKSEAIAAALSFLGFAIPEIDGLKTLKQLFYDNNFDGGFYKNEIEDAGSTSYVIDNPTQIKLADGNNTTFDPNNPDIRYEKGGNVITPDTQLISVEPSIRKVMKILDEGGHKALIIGGAVRDALLGIEPKDIDIEVYNITYNDLGDILAKFGRVDLVGKAFGVIKFHPRGSNLTYDFSVPRKENKIGIGHTDFKITFDKNMTIAEAGARRDFTFNALAYDPIENKIYDYFGGMNDLYDGIIKHTSDAFREDALRILRAMQFQARFGFTIHPSTNKIMREMLQTNDFNDLSKERVYEEWRKWAEKGINHDLIFKFMRDSGLIEYYPELKLLKETPQDYIYHPEGDVEIHTEMTLKEMDELIEKNNIRGEEKVILVMSILLHDIAKPQTTKEEMKRDRMTITSKGHEALGGEMSKDFLERIGFPESIYVPIANLVANHLAGVNISMIPEKSGKLKAVKKLSRRLHPATIHQLIYVMDADNLGRGTARKEATGKLELLELSAEANVFDKQMKPILMGRHLIELGLKPSIQFKTILDKAFEAQENGEFNDLEGGKMWLKDNISVFQN